MGWCWHFLQIYPCQQDKRYNLQVHSYKTASTVEPSTPNTNAFPYSESIMFSIGVKVSNSFSWAFLSFFFYSGETVQGQKKDEKFADQSHFFVCVFCNVPRCKGTIFIFNVFLFTMTVLLIFHRRQFNSRKKDEKIVENIRNPSFSILKCKVVS